MRPLDIVCKPIIPCFGISTKGLFFNTVGVVQDIGVGPIRFIMSSTIFINRQMEGRGGGAPYSKFCRDIITSPFWARSIFYKRRLYGNGDKGFWLGPYKGSGFSHTS